MSSTKPGRISSASGTTSLTGSRGRRRAARLVLGRPARPQRLVRPRRRAHRSTWPEPRRRRDRCAAPSEPARASSGAAAPCPCAPASRLRPAADRPAWPLPRTSAAGKGSTRGEPEKPTAPRAAPVHSVATAEARRSRNRPRGAAHEGHSRRNEQRTRTSVATPRAGGPATPPVDGSSGTRRPTVGRRRRQPPRSCGRTPGQHRNDGEAAPQQPGRRLRRWRRPMGPAATSSSRRPDDQPNPRATTGRPPTTHADSRACAEAARSWRRASASSMARNASRSNIGGCSAARFGCQLDRGATNSAVTGSAIAAARATRAHRWRRQRPCAATASRPRSGERGRSVCQRQHAGTPRLVARRRHHRGRRPPGRDPRSRLATWRMPAPQRATTTAPAIDGCEPTASEQHPTGHGTPQRIASAEAMWPFTMPTPRRGGRRRLRRSMSADAARCDARRGRRGREPTRAGAGRCPRRFVSAPDIGQVPGDATCASSGPLACTVDIEPSWPVLMAWIMSSASGPRTSPTTMRSGRSRSACRTQGAQRDLAGTLRRWVAGPRAARRARSARAPQRLRWSRHARPGESPSTGR